MTTIATDLTVTLTYESEDGATYGTPDHKADRTVHVDEMSAGALETIQFLGFVEHYMNFFPVSIAGTPDALAALDATIGRTTARYLVDWRTRWEETVEVAA